MIIATIMGTLTNVVIAPHKISNDKAIDLANTKENKIIKERVIAHLQNLVTVYLTSKK